eukprot:8761408-Alexandrium_andersonii.AAC.1
MGGSPDRYSGPICTGVSAPLRARPLGRCCMPAPAACVLSTEVLARGARVRAKAARAGGAEVIALPPGGA